jgi:glycerophosphoryl diester phosphodiesterase
VLVCALVSAACAGADPLVIAHRGASGERPEHTLAAYQLAIEQGADFIEPDLVATKDGVLVARHENEISGTTDVASHPDFEARRTTKTIDGERVTGWFTEDFTLAELSRLRAVERLPDLRGTRYDGQFGIPTLEQILDLVGTRGIGIYPETKHPAYFDSIGLSLEEPLVKALAASGRKGPRARVFIQSFDADNLKQLRRMTELPLVQLVSDRPAQRERITSEGLAAIARYARGIGVAKALVTPELIREAKRHGLLVHVWTFRAENAFLPEDLRSGADPRARGDLCGELRRFLRLGIDGFFTEHVAQSRGC